MRKSFFRKTMVGLLVTCMMFPVNAGAWNVNDSAKLLTDTEDSETVSAENDIVRDYESLVLDQPAVVKLDGSGSKKCCFYFTAEASAQYEFITEGDAISECDLVRLNQDITYPPVVLGEGKHIIKYLTAGTTVDLRVLDNAAGFCTVTVKESAFYLNYDRGGDYGLIVCDPHSSKTLQVVPSDTSDSYTYSWQKKEYGSWKNVGDDSNVFKMNYPDYGYSNYQCIVKGTRHAEEVASFRLYATDLALKQNNYEVEGRFRKPVTMRVTYDTSDTETPVFFKWYKSDINGYTDMTTVLSTTSKYSVVAEGKEWYVCHVSQGDDPGTPITVAAFTVNGFDLYVDDSGIEDPNKQTEAEPGQSFTLQADVKSYNTDAPISYKWVYVKGSDAESSEDTRAIPMEGENKPELSTSINEEGNYCFFCVATQEEEQVEQKFPVYIGKKDSGSVSGNDAGSVSGNDVGSVSGNDAGSVSGNDAGSVSGNDVPGITPTATHTSITEKTGAGDLSFAPSLPKKIKISKGKGSIKVTAKKKGNISGYQIRYKTGKAKWKTVKVAGNKNLKKTIKKLKHRKKYKLQIRSYLSVNGKNTYSKWSKTYSCKTK